MATLTNAELDAMSFGYLTGADLAMWASYQVIIKQYETSPDKLQLGCDNAYSEMIGYFFTKYDVLREFNMVSGPRQQIVVKLTAILAVRNILGNMAGLGEVTKGNFEWADYIIARTQDGTFNLPLYVAACTVNSGAFMVRENFGLNG